MKTLVSSLSVAAMVLATAVAPAQAGASPARPSPAADALSWSSCGISGFPSLDCAQLEVPLNRSLPGGPTIALTISRAAATGPGPHSALLVNPGGPGVSGLAMAGGVAAALSPEVRARYDVIGFDPRGVGRSEPSMSCVPGYFKGPRQDFVPTTPSEARSWLDRTAAYSAACGAAYADYLPFMRTTDTAGDMDDIRAALGQERIAYYGSSYGTFLGAVYATRYPRRVNRLVMDGVVSPEGLTYEDQFAQDRGFESSLAAFLRWTARYDDVYGLGDTPQKVHDAFYGLRSRLAGHPALDGVFGSAEFDVTFMRTGYESASWPELAKAIADVVNSADESGLAAVFASHGPPQTSDAFFAALNAVRCTDTPWPRDPGTYLRDGARSARTAPFTSWNDLWFTAPCMSWPVPGGPAPKIEARPGAPRVLMLSAEHDPASPYDQGLAMHRLLPSRLVTETGGWRHGVAMKDDACVDDLMNTYLASGRLPARDTDCPVSLPTP